VSDTLQLSENPPVSERRFHWRQKVLLSCVELGEENGGIVLNLSQGGLALQAVEEMDNDELPKVRFQFSQSNTWVEAKGRVAWRSKSKKMIGVEFTDLSDEAREQIRTWISSLVPADLHHFSNLVPVSAEPSITGAPRDLSYQKQKYDRDVDNNKYPSSSRHAFRLFGKILSAVLFLSSAIFVGYHFRRAASHAQTRQVTDNASAPALAKTSTNLGPAANLTTKTNPTLSFDDPGFALQVAAMTHEENADALANSLRQKSFPAFVVQLIGNRFYRVFIGPYGDAEGAQQVKEELKKQGFEAIRTKWPPPIR
jgi:hypothetical protein